VKQKRYDLAMAVVMENHFDSIVVDDVETVKRCIDYLKEQKWHAMTFLPLESITAQAPDQRSALAGCF
jgi:chromosome segregation ATPase